jgi:kelch-like protein 10
MGSRRAYLASVALNGFIYVMGGSDGSNRLDTAEKYDPATDRWTPRYKT